MRFGVFEADLASGELRKHGIRIKLHDQPFKVLTVLLERPGEVVTRERLFEKLWPAGTLVDLDAGLNSAILKLREALGDSAENPRFVETLPRRGYRLIVEVVGIDRRSPVEPQAFAHANGHHKLDNTSLNGSGSNARVSEVPADLPVTMSPRKFLWRTLSAFGALLILGGLAVWIMRPPPQRYSIAVLPLKNLGPDPGGDYFSDGLTDEIISNLSIIDGLEVKSRTSSFAFKAQQRDIHQVGAQLDANLVLEGSVLHAGDRLRVNVQLIRVADDLALWSGRYDRNLKDIFAIQDDISRSIVNELRLKLGRGQRRYNTNVEVYDSYLRAKALLNGMPGSDSDRIAASIPLFEAAITKDSHFAPAYAGIANAYAYLSATPRTFSPALAYPKMKEACERALQLDPLLPEAHACMGTVYARDRAWADSEKSFRRALELNPNLSIPRQDLALFVLVPLGRSDEALGELRTSLKLDPLSTKAKNLLDYVLVIKGRYEEALENCDKVLAADPGNYAAMQLRGRALVQQGRTQEGIAIFEKLGFGAESFLGYAYAKAGRAADAEKIAAEHRDWPWLQAVVYGGLGDKDHAYQGLLQMIAIGDPRAGNFAQFPELSLLRGDPRLVDFRKTLEAPVVH